MKSCALEFKGIVHRGLRPENIFVYNNIYKLGDFGLSQQSARFGTNAGTGLSKVPEFYSDSLKTAQAGIWALGCIFHMKYLTK